MDKHMEKKKKWEALRTGLLTAAAVMLVMSALMGTAWAYFSTYATAKGGITLHMGHEETVEEDFNSWQKVINITSTKDSRPVYIRARGFCPDYDITYECDNWEQPEGDDWVYYQEILPPGETADPLKVQIKDVPSGENSGIQDADSFNVIIVYETTEVQYDESGNQIAPENADWNRKIETYRTGTEASTPTEQDSSGETSSAKYIWNTNTNKYHYSNCKEVSKILDEHKFFFNNVQEIEDLNLEPCKVCNPE